MGGCIFEFLLVKLCKFSGLASLFFWFFWRIYIYMSKASMIQNDDGYISCVALEKLMVLFFWYPQYVFSPCIILSV